MTRPSIVSAPDPKAILIGTVAFVALVFGVPLVAAVVASIGPLSLFEERVGPFFAIKYVLVLVAGAVTGIVARRSTILSGVIVGLAGELVLILSAALFGYWELNGHNALQATLRVMSSAVVCAIGSAGATFFLRQKIAL
jgi:hypothetical protein